MSTYGRRGTSNPENQACGLNQSRSPTEFSIGTLALNNVRLRLPSPRIERGVGSEGCHSYRSASAIGTDAARRAGTHVMSSANPMPATRKPITIIQGMLKSIPPVSVN
jgi:hypothetical protein